MWSCIWRASKNPSSPLVSSPSVLSARRICQFSFSLFVPALIRLSKPWLASLTAAEHRSFSTPTKNTHLRHCGMMLMSTHTHLLLHLLPLSSLAHSRISKNRRTYSAIIFCELSELIAFTSPSVNCNPTLTLQAAWVMGHSGVADCGWCLCLQAQRNDFIYVYNILFLKASGIS